MTNEYPPQENREEAVEHFEGDPVDTEKAIASQKEAMAQEVDAEHTHSIAKIKSEIAEKMIEQEEIKAIKKDEGFVATTPKDPVAKIVTSEDFVPDTGFKFKVPKFLSRAVAALGFAGIMASGAHASTNEGEKGLKKDIKKTEKVSQKPQGGLQFYAGGIEKTPTGKDNAFDKSESILTQDGVYEMAAKFGLSTESNLDFQKSLIEKYPDAVKKVMDSYGQTNAGTFLDGILGARVTKVLEEISTNTKEKTPEVKKEIPKPIETIADFFAGQRGESFFNSAGHLEAISRYKVHTDGKEVELMFVDKMGKPTGDMYTIPTSEFANKFTGGKNRIQTREGLAQYVTSKDQNKNAHYLDGLSMLN